MSRPGETLPGEHRFDPGKGERLVRSNTRYPGVGVGRPEHPHPQLPDAVHIVDEVAEAAQQAPVFEAPDPPPDKAHWAWSPASSRGDTPSTRSSEVSCEIEPLAAASEPPFLRSEERRVGKECRS